METKEHIKDNLPTLILLVICIILNIISFFNLIPPWFTPQLQPILIGVIAVFGGLFFHQTVKLDRLNKTIVDSFSKPVLKKISTADEIFNYIAKKIKHSERSVLHVAFAKPISENNCSSLKKYKRAVDNLLIDSAVNYTYIAGIEKAHISRLEVLIQRLKNPKITNYETRYYKIDNSYPSLSFMIFDKNEVVIYYPDKVGEPDAILATQDTIVLNIYQDYFDRLFNDSQKINTEVAEELLENYKILN